MGHSQAACQRLGRLLVSLSQRDLTDIADRYITELMYALRCRVSREQHVNVLQHIMGYLKREIDGGDKAELARKYRALSSGGDSVDCADYPAAPLFSAAIQIPVWKNCFTCCSTRRSQD